jgi:hypothetical protein
MKRIRNWFKYRLPMYWKAIIAWLAPIFLAIKQWYGDSGKSQFTKSDWINLGIAAVIAMGVQAKTNKPYTVPGSYPETP